MLPAHVRIVLCTQPQDFRKSFAGLALVVRQALAELNGMLFSEGSSRSLLNFAKGGWL